MSDAFDRELLDAYLDGELDSGERAEVERHLAASAELRAELDAVRRVRDTVRGLPPVAPPFGFFERLRPTPARPGRSWRAVAASVVAVAAAWTLVLGAGSGLGVLDAVPAVDDFADRHAAAVEAMPGPAETDEYEAVPMDDASRYGPHTAGSSMVMMGAYQRRGALQLVYADGPHVVSVFREEMHTDLDDLGAGERMDTAAGPAWHGVVRGMDVMVAVRGKATYTVVGDAAAMPVMTELVDHLPDRGPSWGDRARGAARELLETVGFA